MRTVADKELPRTRAEAKANSSKRYFTGKPCVNGHVAPRYLSSGGCVVCTSERHGEWADKNPGAAKDLTKAWFKANPERVRQLKKADYLRNKTKRDLASRKWRDANPDKVREMVAAATKKRRSTPSGRLDHSMQSGITRGLMSGGAKGGRRTYEILGYTPACLRRNLERQFTTGMTWENYGRGGWHVDHVIPRSAFNYETTDDIDFKKCWSLKNLQPLWETDNLAKGGKLAKPFQPSLALAAQH